LLKRGRKRGTCPPEFGGEKFKPKLGGVSRVRRGVCKPPQKKDSKKRRKESGLGKTYSGSGKSENVQREKVDREGNKS